MTPMNRTARHALISTLILAIAAACSSCASNGDHDLSNGGPTAPEIPPAESVEGPADARAIAIERHREQQLTSKFGDYPFRAVSMRIHPLTRVMTKPSTDGASRIIEARLEFSDPFGDTTKAFGELQFALYARPASGVGAGSESPLLIKWEPEFSRIRVNATHFDSVTRTYLFRLEIEDDLHLPSECVLEAHVRSFRDELEARTELAIPQPETAAGS